jgi:hypothetical protein
MDMYAPFDLQSNEEGKEGGRDGGGMEEKREEEKGREEEGKERKEGRKVSCDLAFGRAKKMYILYLRLEKRLANPPFLLHAR